MANITPGEIHFNQGEKPDLKEGMTQGDVFYRTYIRIDTPTYQVDGRQNLGFQSKEDSQQFYFKWHKALMELGIAFPEVPEEEASSLMFTPDGRRLHLHPDDVVGYMTQEEMKQIQAYLKHPEHNKSGSSLRWIDCYQVTEYVTTEEFDKRIELEQDSIDEAVFNFFQTKQKTHFRDASIFDVHSMAPVIIAAVESLCLLTDFHSFNDAFHEKHQLKAHMKKLHSAFTQSFDRLKGDGRIIPDPVYMQGYRSLNKTEMKTWQAQQNREQKAKKKATMGMTP